MTTQLALKENEVERDNPVRQSNPIPVNSKPYYRIIVIKRETHEEKILNNAMENLGEVIEEPTITKTAEKTLKPIKLENKNLDSIVGNYHNFNINPELNVIYNKNRATLAEPDNLMAHYTTAGANIFNDLGNNLGSKVKNLYKGIRNIKEGTVKKIGAVVSTAGLVLLLSTGCGGVTPEHPGPNDNVADSHKVTAIAPYYETEEGKHYCLISRGVIVTNYEANYGVENPQKVLTQQELADAIFGTVGTKPIDLVNYINSRTDLNLKAEIQYLSILEIQKMLEDDIVPIVVIQSGTDVLLPIGYDKTKSEITTYAALDGNEHTMDEFKYLDPDYNKSVMIINKKKLSTYLDNLL